MRQNRTVAALCVLLGASFGPCVLALADGTPENLLIIIDPRNPESMYVGNYYKAARNIPDSNVLYMEPRTDTYQNAVDRRIKPMLGSLVNQGIEDHIDYVLVVPNTNYRISASGLVSDSCVAVNRFATSSIYTTAFMTDEILAGTRSTTGNRYFARNDTAIAFDSSVAWFNGVPSTSSSARRYLIGAMLGYTGEQGNTVEEILAMVDRSVDVDGTRPEGTIYYMQTTDSLRSGPRHGTFPAAVASIQGFGGQAEHLQAVLPTGRHDALGIMTGWAGPDIDGADMTVLPGAFADHLTSFAGHFGAASQTKMSRWIAKGASGSVGAVEEPCNYGGKFPHARMHVYYYQGMTLGESAFRSLGFVPFQGLLYGDPLTRPFAYIPSVDVIDAPGGPVSGVIVLTPEATTDNPGAAIDSFDLLVDGVLAGQAGLGGQFMLDTAAYADGLHDVRVIAYDDTTVNTAGRWIGSVDIANNSLGVSSGVTPGTGDLNTAFSFEVAANGAAVREIRLVQGSRVVAATQSASDSLTVHGQILGAGLVSVIAEAEYADGRVARSDPVNLSIDYVDNGPSGALPVAYSYHKTVRDDQSFVLELPASYDDSPVDAVYAWVTRPTNATVINDTDGPFRILVPTPCSGSDVVRFKVTTAAGESNVGEIQLTYASRPLGPCPADFNGDGVVNTIDFLTFLILFDLGDPEVDMNRDCAVNTLDFLVYLNMFNEGC